MRLILLGILLCVSACSPRSPEEFQQEGQALCEDLIDTLQTISSREDLMDKESVLKKKFQTFVTLMVEARRVQADLDDAGEWEQGPTSLWVSERLKAHLRRVYQLEGGRELIEKMQQDSLVKLDANERLTRKRREKTLR